jgi:formylmethanofuran dehydrogenase subunit E
MYYTDDPVRDFARHDAEQARQEERLPHCDYCGEVIYEKYYEINGKIVCEDCLEDLFAQYVEE